MSYIIAVDSGGTFCDCVAFDSKGKVTRAKAPGGAGTVTSDR